MSSFIFLNIGRFSRKLIYITPTGDLFLPFVNIIYNFKGLRKQNFLPYFSVGVGGRIELLEDYGIIFNQIRMGIRHYIIRSSETGLVLNLGVSSIHGFLFHPILFSLFVGLEFCIFY